MLCLKERYNFVVFSIDFRTWFWIGTIAISVHVSILCFLAIYCNFLKKIGPDEWEKQYPKAIPLATFSVIVGIIW